MRDDVSSVNVQGRLLKTGCEANCNASRKTLIESTQRITVFNTEACLSIFYIYKVEFTATAAAAAAV